MSFHSKKCTFFLHSSLSTRFDFSRVRIAFSGLLAFTWGFSNWFYSGLKKRSWKKIENFWSKIDFKIEIEKFSKIFEIFEKIKIFRFFSFFSENFLKIFNWNPTFFDFRFFENFRENEKIEKILIFRNFRKFFDLDFEIDFRSKNFNLFPWSFFKPLKNQFENPTVKARSPGNATRTRVIVLRCGQVSM